MFCNHGQISSIPNLCQAWQEFARGKKHKRDVVAFSLNLSQEIYNLHHELVNQTYRHGSYAAFSINDPKPRSIHKASVRDRLLHHAIYRVLYPYFDRKFIYDSYSCRDHKGTHRALDRLQTFAQRVSRNNRRTAWVLKCDVRKFFASIDHATLLSILARHISDSQTINLLREVIGSFHSSRPAVGLPLGNLTSQLLVNIYLNEFDQFVKHELKLKHYIRYADDFLVLHHDKQVLLDALLVFQKFLADKLNLTLHPDKIFIQTIASGLNFLGWVHFPDHRVVRASTRRRMFKKLALAVERLETLQSYLGLLIHGNGFKLQTRLKLLAIDKKGV